MNTEEVESKSLLQEQPDRPDEIALTSFVSQVVDGEIAPHEWPQMDVLAARELPTVEDLHGPDGKALARSARLECSTLAKLDFALLAHGRLVTLEVRQLEAGEAAPGGLSTKMSIEAQLKPDELAWRNRVMRLAELVEPMMCSLASNEGWKCLGPPSGQLKSQVYIRHHAGQLDVKASGVIPQRIEAVIGAFAFINELAKWLPGLSASRQIASLSTFHKLIYLQTPGYWPVKPRFMTVEALGDVINGDSIMVMLRTLAPTDTDPDHTEEFAAGAKATTDSLCKGNVMCGFESGVLMKPIDGGDAVEVSMLTRLDLKLPILPRWLIDFVSKKLAPQTIPMLAKQSAKVAKGGPLEHLWEADEYTGLRNSLRKRLMILHTIDNAKLMGEWPRKSPSLLESGSSAL